MCAHVRMCTDRCVEPGGPEEGGGEKGGEVEEQAKGALGVAPHEEVEGGGQPVMTWVPPLQSGCQERGQGRISRRRGWTLGPV